jgi:16S rRNA (cytosine1402-N4)-methyltransferase
LLGDKLAHIPVLVTQVLEHLITDPGGVYVDGTVGGGGHAEEVLGRLTPDGRLLAADWDDAALQVASERLASFGGRVSFYRNSLSELPGAIAQAGVGAVTGILVDLGLSSNQLAAKRGFSFQEHAPLDMRMDCRGKLNAGEIVNDWSGSELREILSELGEERQAGRIAERIVSDRPFTDTAQLAAAISRAVGGRHGKLHPATRTFQALRLKVNDELGQLASFLESVPSMLCSGGRLVIIAFQSLEDRMVKRYLRGPGKAMFRELTKRPLRPSREEAVANPRCRSAKLRAAVRL